MNECGGEKNSNMVQVKYKKINLKDLQFDMGDSFHGRGQFGDVKKAKWNDKVVAVKYFNSADRKCGFSQELVSLSLLQGHENIVTMHGACYTDHPFIVLEFAPLSLEKVLHEYKKKYWYTSDHVMSWSHQMALGLEYIHSKNMLHRDIKPSNILLFNYGSKLKLCDFGTAKKIENTLSMTNAVGTIRYMAPEVIKGKHYSAQCDIFSYGIVLWEMLTRRRPMPSQGQGNPLTIMFQMANGATPQKIHNLPRPIADLIDRCFDPEPRNRPPVTEIRKKLEYLCQFVKKVGPLIPRRQQPKQAKQEATQSDVFVADKQGTQKHAPRVSADSAIEYIEEREEEQLVSKSPPKEPPPPEAAGGPPPPTIAGGPQDHDQVITGLPSDNEKYVHPRNRSQTVPERPNETIKESRPPGKAYQSQVSSPPTDSPASYQPSYHPSPQDHYRHQTPPTGMSYGTMGRRPGGRQESEYESIEVMSDEFLQSDNDMLQVQSERYQLLEEVMTRTTNFPVASGNSEFTITGIELELQPILPNENNPQSMDLYRQYNEVAEEIVKARKEYDTLMEENVKLNKEMESDRQKLAKQAEVHQEYEKQCRLKDQLMSEYSRLDQECKSLRASNPTMPPT